MLHAAIYVFSVMALVYFVLGVIVASIRIMIHDMPWQLFVFTIIFWPVAWLD